MRSHTPPVVTPDPGTKKGKYMEPTGVVPPLPGEPSAAHAASGAQAAEGKKAQKRRAKAKKSEMKRPQRIGKNDESEFGDGLISPVRPVQGLQAGPEGADVLARLQMLEEKLRQAVGRSNEHEGQVKSLHAQTAFCLRQVSRMQEEQCAKCVVVTGFEVNDPFVREEILRELARKIGLEKRDVERMKMKTEQGRDWTAKSTTAELRNKNVAKTFFLKYPSMKPVDVQYDGAVHKLRMRPMKTPYMMVAETPWEMLVKITEHYHEGGRITKYWGPPSWQMVEESSGAILAEFVLDEREGRANIYVQKPLQETVMKDIPAYWSEIVGRDIATYPFEIEVIGAAITVERSEGESGKGKGKGKKKGKNKRIES